MKTLDEKAIQHLNQLLKTPKPTTCTVNGNAREVTVQVIHDFGKYRIINLTFYAYDEEWRFREPEIAIIHDTDTNEYLPSNIIYDTERINSSSAHIYNGQLTVWNDKKQADHIKVVNDLLNQISL